jgi:hypothetical protein
VLTENVAVFDPGAMATVAGTLAIEGLALESATTAPLAGALLSVTRPVEALPLATLAGVNVSEETVIPDELDGVTLIKVVFCALAP